MVVNKILFQQLDERQGTRVNNNDAKGLLLPDILSIEINRILKRAL